MNDNDQYDLVEFGQSPRRGIAPYTRRVMVAVVAMLAIAGAVLWVTSRSAPLTSARGRAAVSTTANGGPTALPRRPAGVAILRAGTHYGHGSEDAGPTFWLEFDVLPPPTTLSEVTASVAPVSGLTDARVFFYRPADGKIDVASGTFGAHASLRTLPAGVGFTAVVVWTPTCTAMPPLQAIAIRISYTAADGPGVMDLVGAPDVSSADVSAPLVACIHGPG